VDSESGEKFLQFLLRLEALSLCGVSLEPRIVSLLGNGIKVAALDEPHFCHELFVSVANESRIENHASYQPGKPYDGSENVNHGVTLLFW
jgi:hypothetical protein